MSLKFEKGKDWGEEKKQQKDCYLLVLLNTKQMILAQLFDIGTKYIRLTAITELYI